MRKRLIVSGLLLFILNGCLFFKSEEVATFQIKSTKETNRATPFYIAVKEVEASEFLLDTYQKIATQKFFDCKDPSVLATLVMIPGSTRKISVPFPEKKMLAIYFLFTDPGEGWKYLVNEREPCKIKILLDERGMKLVNVF